MEEEISVWSAASSEYRLFFFFSQGRIRLFFAAVLLRGFARGDREGPRGGGGRANRIGGTCGGGGRANRTGGGGGGGGIDMAAVAAAVAAVLTSSLQWAKNIRSG